MKYIKEKVEAYDKVLEWATEAHKVCDGMLKEDLEHLFPELKESEDERIRKALLNHLKEASRGKTLVVNTLDYKRWADWLEKQGKNSMCISEATKQKLEDNLNKALEKETPESFNEFLDEQDEQKPAYNTDKLKEEYQKGWDAAMLQLPKEVDSQIWQIANNSAKTWDESFAILCATQKAYYKGKKDALKEQNSTWSEEDETKLKSACALIRNTSLNGNEGLVDSTIDWLKSLKERVQLQPKQEWKQENTDDLTDFEGAMMHIGGSFFGDNAGLDPNDTNTIKEQANLLLELVPKQEWSKEDDYYYGIIQYILNNECVGRADKEIAINWLKSLKERYTWKPSDEQMKRLKGTINSLPHQEVLYSLKKLKGE